jgi:hypothetical protein
MSRGNDQNVTQPEEEESENLNSRFLSRRCLESQAISRNHTTIPEPHIMNIKIDWPTKSPLQIRKEIEHNNQKWGKHSNNTRD